MRRAKIVATIGPASSPEGCLRRLIAAGVDVVRLNFSHGTPAEHLAVAALARRLAAEAGRYVAVLQDLQGPKIRTGWLRDHAPVPIPDGATLVLTTEEIPGSAERVSVTYPALPSDVQPGDRILLRDGLLELRVVAKTDTDVTTTVIHGGELVEHSGINLPGVRVSAPALSEKDRADLIYGLREIGVDYVALSFVRRPEDLALAKDVMREVGVTVPLIAKIEKPEAIEHLAAIMSHCEGVMVARGDLGVEMAPEEVPVLQKRIIAEANELGILVITATEMLQSMTENPRPTRAEASDVANAIIDDTDAVMLSGETASGHYPVESVQMMGRIVEQAEESGWRAVHPQRQRVSHAHAVTRAAGALADQTSVAAIVVFSRSGRTAGLVAKDRSHAPIYAVTESEPVARRMALLWGVTPIVCPFREHPAEAIRHVEDILLRQGCVRPGQTVLVVTSLPPNAKSRANCLFLHMVGEAAHWGE